MSTAQIDPRLLNALRTAKPGSKVQAVITFGSKDGELLSRQSVDEIVGQMFKHATAKSGTEPLRKKVFYSLQSVSLEADPEFLKSALDEEAIQSATLNVAP